MKVQSKIKTVLVGVDFSRFSKATVKQARAIAKKIKVPLVLVHVFENPLMTKWNDSASKHSLSDVYMKQIKKNYSLEANDKAIVRCGVAFEEILTVAKNTPSPLIVVGSRGKRGAIARFFLGSTAERLALQSSYPLLIHKGQKIVLPKKILIPCDFSSRSKNTIEGSKKLGLKDMSFELYHVLQPPAPILDYPHWQIMFDDIKKINEQELSRFQKKYGPLKVAETNNSDVTGTIEKHSKSFDWIAISPRKHKGIFPSFGSVTSKVVRSGEISVLVIP
jgi:nucleotide-binding universal stress UspA family protein